MSQNETEGLIQRATRLAPLYGDVQTQTAVEITGIPRSSVTRMYRVFRMIDSGQSDEEIVGASRDFSVRSVAAIRTVYREAVPRGRQPDGLGRFLRAHRARMRNLARELRSAAMVGIPAWPDSWLCETWPSPWTGEFPSDPTFSRESQPQFSLMLDHLDQLRVWHALNTVRGLAKAMRGIAVQIEDGITGECREILSGAIRRAAILYGAQISESPTQEFPPIFVQKNDQGFNLSVGTYTQLFGEERMAEEAAACARYLIEQVRQDPLVAEFYSASSHARDALGRLATTLEISEAIDLEIDRNTCVACEGVVELVQDDLSDKGPEWPV